jgi:hypothetical protein
LRGVAGGGGVGGKGGGGGRGEKWTKPCMHIWIIKEKWKKKFLNRNKLILKEVIFFALKNYKTERIFFKSEYRDIHHILRNERHYYNVKSMQINLYIQFVILIKSLQAFWKEGGMLGFELWAYALSHSTGPFLWFFFFFWDRVLQTICLGSLQTSILMVSTSWVARITGMSHQCPAPAGYF